VKDLVSCLILCQVEYIRVLLSSPLQHFNFNLTFQLFIWIIFVLSIDFISFSFSLLNLMYLVAV